MGDVLLQAVPPYQDFAKHSMPQPAESQTSALYDVRWAEGLLGVLQERDSFNDAREKLSGAKTRQPGEGEESQ